MREEQAKMIQEHIESMTDSIPSYNNKDCGECNCVEIEQAKKGGEVKNGYPCLKPIIDLSEKTVKPNFEGIINIFKNQHQ